MLNLNEFRNKIAHNVFEYNPNDRKVYVKDKILDEEIDKKISDVGELLIDIDIMLSFVKDGKGYKYAITKHVANCYNNYYVYTKQKRNKNIEISLQD